MTSLQQIAEVVIGVDTHVHTHSAAVVDARTGGVLAEITVTADADGYQELIDFAGQHSGQRAWAIEGTGGHGNGLARVLAQRDEPVIELDRPERAKRRNGAKSDPSTPSAQPGKPCRGTIWARPGRTGTGRPCRCCWPPASRPSRAPVMPSGSCSAW